MIHLIDPRHATPMYLLTEWPLRTRYDREVRSYRWLSDRNAHDAQFIAIREETGLWRVTKARFHPIPDRPVRRKTLERMVLETMAKVEELS